MRTGRPVLFFAEGTRSADGSLQPFKRGAFVIALKAGVPIVPVSVSGSYEILPKGSLRIRPGQDRGAIRPPDPDRGLHAADPRPADREGARRGQGRDPRERIGGGGAAAPEGNRADARGTDRGLRGARARARPRRRDRGRGGLPHPPGGRGRAGPRPGPAAGRPRLHPGRAAAPLPRRPVPRPGAPGGHLPQARDRRTTGSAPGSASGTSSSAGAARCARRSSGATSR